jgi:thiol-disulfide isomerase/thioredoxin
LAFSLTITSLSSAYAQASAESPAAAPAASVSSEAKPKREVHLIYMGGNDCPPCVAWRKDELPKLMQTEAFKKVKFSFVTKSINSPMPARFFLPSEVKPYKDKLDTASNGISGSPQFALLVNGEVFDYYSSMRNAEVVEKMLISANLASLTR